MENVTNEQITELLEKVRVLKEKSDANPDVILEKYNFFNFLGLGHDECVFSMMIANLLKVNAAHGFGTVFLESFIKKLSIEGFPAKLNFAKAEVKIEYDIGPRNDSEKKGGRIDIFIEIPDNNGKDWAFIIENKIWAGDQSGQMTRYHTFGRQTYKDGFALLYLTLDGHEPSEDSIGELDSKKNDYRCISYRDHIIPWLQQCAQLAFDNPRVREVIVQYINVLQQLTNQNTREENKDALTKLLSAEANFPQAWEIAENLFATKQYLVENVLCEQLKNLGYNITECTYGRGNYGGITITIPDWKHCSVTFEFERLSGTTDLCYGITGQSEEDYTNIFSKNRYGTTNTWTAWKWMEKYRYWTNIDTFMDIYSGEVAKEMGKCIEELLEIVTTNHMEL